MADDDDDDDDVLPEMFWILKMILATFILMVHLFIRRAFNDGTSLYFAGMHNRNTGKTNSSKDNPRGGKLGFSFAGIVAYGLTKSSTLVQNEPFQHHEVLLQTFMVG